MAWVSTILCWAGRRSPTLTGLPIDGRTTEGAAPPEAVGAAEEIGVELKAFRRIGADDVDRGAKRPTIGPGVGDVALIEFAVLRSPVL